MGVVVYYGLQPALVIAALALWTVSPDPAFTLAAGSVGGQVILGVLERIRPARPEWNVAARPWLVHVVAFVALAGLFELFGSTYRDLFAGPLAELRTSAGLDLWPHHWPRPIQLLLVFFASEFAWYWMHRAEHRWAWVWRLTGHGAHHSFKQLGALNAGLNHPFELIPLMLPAATIEIVFGVGGAATGAALLTVTQAAIAHANLELNTRGIGWLLTTNRYHIHHHSVVLEESNTNYGCAAIVWDRLFGTFSDGDTREAGTGPSEPSLWRKLLMPFVEPDDTATAPGTTAG